MTCAYPFEKCEGRFTVRATRDRKLYCPLAKKAVEKCCCEEVKEQARDSAA